MVRLALSLAAWLLATPLVAQTCTGTDIRDSLSAEQRSGLAEMTAGLTHPEGNHWRATRGDAVVHLIGTLHVDDPRHDAVMARIGPVIDSAAALLVEATDEEEAALQSALARDPSLIVTTDGPTLPELLTEEEWQRVRAAAAERNIPGVMAAKFRPWYLTLLLSLPPCMMEAMATGMDGLDARIMDRAAAAGVPTSALEPYDTLFTLFAALDVDDQAEMAVASIPAPGEAEDMFAALLAGYFEERHAEIWTLAHFMAKEQLDLPPERIDEMFAMLRDVAVTERNANWIPVILDAVETAGGPVVVAAGAAHLSGSDGVLALLEAEGFALERLPFR